MARIGLLTNFLFAILMISISLQGALAIKCWTCTSDASNAAFCRDPFDTSTINTQQKREHFNECLQPPNRGNQTSNKRAVCRKIVKLVKDEYVISRSCFWENINASKDECIINNTPSFIKTEFCGTCDTDGCNGSAQIGPVALMVAIPVAITKILLS